MVLIPILRNRRTDCKIRVCILYTNIILTFFITCPIREYSLLLTTLNVMYDILYCHGIWRRRWKNIYTCIMYKYVWQWKEKYKNKARPPLCDSGYCPEAMWIYGWHMEQHKSSKWECATHICSHSPRVNEYGIGSMKMFQGTNKQKCFYSSIGLIEPSIEEFIFGFRK